MCVSLEFKSGQTNYGDFAVKTRRFDATKLESQGRYVKLVYVLWGVPSIMGLTFGDMELKIGCQLE